MSADTPQLADDVPECAQGVRKSSPERMGRLQRLSYAAIHAAAPEGLTAHETALATGFDWSAIQPRISELRRRGLVLASGNRRRNPSGKMATVWITPPPPTASPKLPSADYKANTLPHLRRARVI